MKHQTLGNGPDCLITPEHGASYVLPGGSAWCPSQAHDKADPIEPGLLTKQQAWLEAKAKKGEGNDQPAEPEAAAAG